MKFQEPLQDILFIQYFLAYVERVEQAKQAKPQTVEKVCKIVKNQLALPDDSNVTGESTLASLGADSLDTVKNILPNITIASGQCSVDLFGKSEYKLLAKNLIVVIYIYMPCPLG